jgi:hypothetical protein
MRGYFLTVDCGTVDDRQMPAVPSAISRLEQLLKDRSV